LSALEERIVIDRPVDDVHRVLSHEESDWLEPFLRLAAHKGERAGMDLRARLKHGAATTPDMPRTVRVALGSPTVHVEGNAIEIPISIRTRGYRCVFPTLDGRLLIARAEGEKTSLSLRGVYGAPVPVTGGIDDSLVAQLAAQTTLRDLLQNLCLAMESDTSRNTMAEGSS
jgi:hypothetical protein